MLSLPTLRLRLHLCWLPLCSLSRSCRVFAITVTVSSTCYSVLKAIFQHEGCVVWCRNAGSCLDAHHSTGSSVLSLPLLTVQCVCWLCYYSTQHARLVVSDKSLDKWLELLPCCKQQPSLWCCHHWPLTHARLVSLLRLVIDFFALHCMTLGPVAHCKTLVHVKNTARPVAQSCTML